MALLKNEPMGGAEDSSLDRPSENNRLTDPEYENTKILRKVGRYVSVDTA